MVSIFVPDELLLEGDPFLSPREVIELGGRAVAVGGTIVNWFDSALELLGDILDPILPGFAGSETRGTSSTTTLALVNKDRARKGLPPLGGGRRRRKRALTLSDRADIAFISGTLGKPAGRDFAMIVAARSG